MTVLGKGGGLSYYIIPQCVVADQDSWRSFNSLFPAQGSQASLSLQPRLWRSDCTVISLVLIKWVKSKMKLFYFHLSFWNCTVHHPCSSLCLLFLLIAPVSSRNLFFIERTMNVSEIYHGPKKNQCLIAGSSGFLRPSVMWRSSGHQHPCPSHLAQGEQEMQKVIHGKVPWMVIIPEWQSPNDSWPQTALMTFAMSAN